VSSLRGIERWIPRAWLLVVLVVLMAPRPARAEAPRDPSEDDYAIGEQGHRFRVRFDPVSRISLGIAGAVGRAPSGAPHASPEISAGITYRKLSIKGAGKERIIWQADSHILSGYVRPSGPVVGRVPALDAALYRAELLRHDEAPSIVLPMSPPASVPFPFDIGFETELGRVFVPSDPPLSSADGAKAPMLQVGVMRAAAILDPWRTGLPGRSLEIGLGARYDIDAYPALGLKAARFVHRVAPMTAASLRFRFQSQDGLALLDVRADVIPHWTSESIWRVAALGSARLSRTLIAINDQPIDAVFEGGYRLLPATSATLALHDIRVSLGLSFNLQLK
jgi:hypothetical protein